MLVESCYYDREDNYPYYYSRQSIHTSFNPHANEMLHPVLYPASSVSTSCSEAGGDGTPPYMPNGLVAPSSDLLCLLVPLPLQTSAASFLLKIKKGYSIFILDLIL